MQVSQFKANKLFEHDVPNSDRFSLQQIRIGTKNLLLSSNGQLTTLPKQTQYRDGLLRQSSRLCL